MLQATYVFLTFTLSGTPTDVMVSADCFRGAGEPPIRGFQYDPIAAIRAKDKLDLLEHLDVMVSKEDSTGLRFSPPGPNPLPGPLLCGLVG